MDAIVGKLHGTVEDFARDLTHIYDPAAKGANEEVEFFVLAAVSLGLYYSVDRDESEVETLMHDLGHAETAALAQQRKLPEADVAKLYDQRYLEYAQLLDGHFANTDDPVALAALVNALDRHVQGQAGKNDARARQISELLLSVTDKLPQVVASAAN